MAQSGLLALQTLFHLRAPQTKVAMPTILVVDDEPVMAQAIITTLQGALNCDIHKVHNGQKALDLLEQFSVDLIISDIAMPDLNGYQLLEKVRANPQWVNIPFLFLSGRNFPTDIRYGKELGVDDYLTKPVSPDDLIASVRGKLRRAEQLKNFLADSSTAKPPQNLLTIGNLEIDRLHHTVQLHGEAIFLSPMEFALLTHLAEKATIPVSAADLVRKTHELDTDSIEASNLIRPLIRSLRRKLGYGVGDMGCIQTVRGIGYQLNPPT